VPREPGRHKHVRVLRVRPNQKVAVRRHRIHAGRARNERKPASRHDRFEPALQLLPLSLVQRPVHTIGRGHLAQAVVRHLQPRAVVGKAVELRLHVAVNRQTRRSISRPIPRPEIELLLPSHLQRQGQILQYLGGPRPRRDDQPLALIAPRGGFHQRPFAAQTDALDAHSFIDPCAQRPRLAQMRQHAASRVEKPAQRGQTGRAAFRQPQRGKARCHLRRVQPLVGSTQGRHHRSFPLQGVAPAPAELQQAGQGQQVLARTRLQLAPERQRRLGHLHVDRVMIEVAERARMTVRAAQSMANPVLLDAHRVGADPRQVVKRCAPHSAQSYNHEVSARHLPSYSLAFSPGSLRPVTKCLTRPAPASLHSTLFPPHAQPPSSNSLRWAPTFDSPGGRNSPAPGQMRPDRTGQRTFLLPAAKLSRRDGDDRVCKCGADRPRPWPEGPPGRTCRGRSACPLTPARGPDSD